ncbi:sensor histidine kinase [Cellulomonas dongxiuzhuiae]|uniref:sensor histidine kinase n=1 Tax=Cellulomonas dongxiuzhuiae TaxID=2819979 RepID=UPI001AAF19CB|nr:sensor histidine kinase [Cellulomonas dongxiuzhuiae]MBO3087121.1 hypothetical protein [Cellulomonas dongxiuzhuiae]
MMVLTVAERVSTPSDGTVVQLSNTPWDSDRILVTQVLPRESGLRESDVVTAARRIPSGDAGAEPPRLASGQELVYTVERVTGGATEMLEVPVRLGAFPMDRWLAANWPPLATVAMFCGIAAFVLRRQPRDPAARSLVLLAGLITSGTVTWLLGDQVAGLTTAGPSVIDGLGELILAISWGAVLHSLLILSGRHWALRPFGYAVCFGLPLAMHAVYLAVMLPRAGSRLEAAGLVAQVSYTAGWVPVGATVLAIVLYRNTPERARRRQLLWLFLGFGFSAACWFGVWILPTWLGLQTPPPSLMPVVFVPAVLALGASILRYRLMDVEVVARRSLLYGALTGVVLAVFAATTWLLNHFWNPGAGASALVSSLLVALFVLPVSAHLRHRIGQVVYGARDDPAAVADALGRIGDQAYPRALLDRIAGTVFDELRLQYVAVVVSSEGGDELLRTVRGTPTSSPYVLPLARRSLAIGRLELGVGIGREPFGPADERLLATLAREVSVLVSRQRLAAELQRARERLVLAREEERRELHHRLHDGLGASLAANGMQLQAARTLLHSDVGEAERILDRLVHSNQDLVGELRGLVYGLRPAAIDQVGLAAALQSRVEQFAVPAGAAPVPRIEIRQSGSLDCLPAATEVAAYWIVVEATHNAVKHSSATSCRIALRRGHTLEVEVRDDGIGRPPDAEPGGGTRSMTERAEELGGSVTITSGRDGGTVVLARLPLTDEEAGA